MNPTNQHPLGKKFIIIDWDKMQANIALKLK